ncbi:UDP-N-acetylmuramoyl-tripeptide--D-alanyl-D-alanine ligase [Kurthia sibirica]|uniref:UDP-N-acetylmuramoyl-tripeptide--D-alanyl-D-alanine ligase n=1 Tax=Kurthia sibirica TaxID=202750 RepID=A0A2U3AK27_9BACL|nr:UDP-N-acetylmuramoyl-tripeptide--D-alanyl-D-alanine ligase [Kurthia sibirica]PWI24898.1 UDP-N-acetylmuramoyl-tripeptide--D-alanyl-D-alanine ligase [Kurthia sibirica]GEK33195.1 UDP-N-acetylmuramoyl-tripeptide--D-alanyl-D-alanine ligase [Kurthia sibirica]
MKKTVQEIMTWLQVEQQLVTNPLITGISINTRTLQKGDLFIPFKGEQTNGHHYIAQAIEAGASATLWQRGEEGAPADFPVIYVEDAEQALQQMAAAYRDELRATFIGITGSNGKTSTKDLVAGTLSAKYKVQKTEGNFNNQLGLPLTILSFDEDVDFAIVEMGMDGFGQIELLTTLAKPHYAIITNIGEAHMEALGTRAGIATAKFEIIKGLQKDGVLFYDGDEPLLQDLVAQTPSLKTVSFGFGARNDLFADTIIGETTGSRFDVHGLVDETFSIQVLGNHQVKNTLAAIGIAHAVGMSILEIKTALKNVSLTNMRMQLVNGQRNILFINDAYNAAPTSVRAALEFMKTTTLRPEKWLILGDMLELGEDEMAYHRDLATAITAEDATYICLFGPRMKVLYEELQRRYPHIDSIWSADDYTPIIDKIETFASDQSIILLKGSRGMALEKIAQRFI